MTKPTDAEMIAKIDAYIDEANRTSDGENYMEFTTEVTIRDLVFIRDRLASLRPTTTIISDEEKKCYTDGFAAGRIAEREHCNNAVKQFWRTFFTRDWTMDDIDALLLRVREGDRP